MDIFNEVYKKNKILDKLFIDKCYDKDMVKKNKLELLVEIGELANETKCFKYWSVKRPSPELVGLELADCIIMCLCFMSYLNMSLDSDFDNIILDDKVDIFFNLYRLTIKFIDTEDKNTLKEIFSNLIHLGHLLEFNNDEIINLCLKKIDNDTKRLENGY